MNKQTIIKSKHTTSDGKSFENFDEAVAHQASLDLVQEFAGISGAYVSGLAFPRPNRRRVWPRHARSSAVK